MEYMELIDTLQIHYKDFVKRMKGRVSYDDYETKSLLDGYTEELASFISKELDKAREEGYKKGYIDGQIEKINKPKTVVSEFDKTSYLN